MPRPKAWLPPRGSERWRVRGVRASPNGRTLKPNICVVVVTPGLDIVLEVTTERTALVSVTIDAAAIPAAERKSLRVTADYGDGGGTLLAFDWTKRDRPTARFSCLRRSDTRALYPFEIVVGLREGHEQRFGPFTVTADTILPTLVLRRP